MSWRHTSVSKCRTHHRFQDTPLYRERFDEVLKFHEPGLAPVRRGTQAWHIGPDGSAAYGRRFLQTFGFYEGMAAVVSPQGWHHIDPNGRDLYDERHGWCGNYQSGRCSVRGVDGAYFHVDEQGRRTYEMRWCYAGDYRDGIAVVQGDDGRSTHIDRDGSLVHGRWFLDLDVFHKGFARARDHRGWAHVGIDGTPAYTRRFSMAEPFYNGQARVETEAGALEVIDPTGATLVTLRPAARDESTREAGQLGRFTGRGVGTSMLWPTMVPATRPVAILLRHAERPEVPEGSSGMEIGLTEAGRAAARRLGATLRERIRSITTSPVGRCRATAMMLCEGADRQLEISDQPLLGAPGAFVADGDVAWESWRRMGNEGVIAYLMTSSEALPGMHLPGLAVRRLLDLLSTALDREAGLHLFVTHDAVLAPFVAHTLGHPLDREQWPGFLDAMMLWREDGELVARYRGGTPWAVIRPSSK